MANSREAEEFCRYVLDLTQTIGPVESRRMFGGYGIFLDGLMFGLIADNQLYLKVDAENKNQFVDEGLEAFAYLKKGKEMKLSYFQAPDDAMENSETMNQWANSAFSAALRAAAKKSMGKK